MQRLSAEQTETLVGMLSKAVDVNQLATYVYLGTGNRLFVEYVTELQPLTPMLRQLLDALEREGTTDKFLRIVYRERPFQTEMRAFILALEPAIGPAAQQQSVLFEFQKAGATTDAPSEGPGLERNIRPANPMLDTGVWIDQFQKITRRVCRIEVNQSGIGTGFLVGPSAVLTNWHVVQTARNAGMKDQLACRFDFRRVTGGGTDPGTLIPVAAVAFETPCSASELTVTPDAIPPTPAQLDYALLRLATPVPERGFFVLADPPPIAPDAGLIIVQHPGGDPLEFAIDTKSVIGFVHDGLRLRYSTNTKAGSSGSPCFSLTWDLQALHHLGDPAAGPGIYNQGVPIGLIRQSITANGTAGLLG